MSPATRLPGPKLRADSQGWYKPDKSLTYRFGTGSPQARQTVALICRGLPQRGQTRSPASILSTGEGPSGAGSVGGTVPRLWCEVVVGWPENSIILMRGRLAATCPLLQTRRSAMSISAVRPSGRYTGPAWIHCAWGASCTTTQADSGTGTIRPQSGHLPASGRPSARTLRRRPQGQLKPHIAIIWARQLPAVLDVPRRTRIFAPHREHVSRSGSPDVTFSVSPHRQVTRAICRPCPIESGAFPALFRANECNSTWISSASRTRHTRQRRPAVCWLEQAVQRNQAIQAA